MKRYIIILAILLIVNQAFTQTTIKKASLNEDASIKIETIVLNEDIEFKSSKSSFENILSFGGPAYTTSKNMRGLAIADIDNDGVEEILFGINNKFYVLKGNGDTLIEKTFAGPILLPPTIADINGDGNLEIILNYGHVGTNGGLAVLNNSGDFLPGWPKTFNSSWLTNAPAVSDINNDGQMEIIVGERINATTGRIHVFTNDGNTYNENWPATIGSTPAFTPSIGDINGDGEKNIVIAGSSTGMYVFNQNAELLPGFPFVNQGVGYSYQSPILADLNGDGKLEIIGSNHGDNPGFYAIKYDATYMPGWPIYQPTWTYSPPTLIDIEGNGEYSIFMGSPNVDMENNSEIPVIYGLNANAEMLDNFPIEKYGGNEGVICVADINDDGVLDLIFGSNITDEEGYGFIHAFSIDGSGELDGFPIRPWGMTFMNGAVLGDINNDGSLDLSCLSHRTTFGQGIDSIFVNTYNLGFEYKPENILVNGYKGSNTRDGRVSNNITNIKPVLNDENLFKLSPNPSSGNLNIDFNNAQTNIEIQIFSLDGKLIYSEKHEAMDNHISLNLRELLSGEYIVLIKSENKTSAKLWVKE
ncbi:MAG: T9SS type A sorting domain-containing protein [Bacteroidales bacterium]|nr:T9SS type A sorting domain-containing protein [Bacteroidales bacterium]